MSVSFSKAVKKPNSQDEYTPDLILEMRKCKNDFFYFCKYIKIVHPDFGKITFEPRWYQKSILEKIINNRNFIGLASRQVGKTTLVAAYALWYCVFNSHKTIGIVSNKEKSAKDILKRLKGMYEDLPHWMKPGVELYNILGVLFDNDTEIMVSATSPDAFRGRALNILFCDELGFVPANIADEFWAANYPTLSASSTSKIIVISTPNGMGNLFHTTFINAEKGVNGFAWCKYDYTVIPGRDANWVKQEKKILGELKFAQEHECKFLGSSNTVINAETLKYLLTQDIEPLHTDLNDRFEIFENPIDGQVYVIGVDIAKGTGEHYSVIQVMKILSYDPFKIEQVAVFHDDHTDVYTFADIVHRVAVYYNKAYLMVENNAEGSTIVSRIWWDFEYENLVNESSKSTGLGIRATKKTKPKAVLLMKKLIEDHYLILYDKKTINELVTFVETGSSFKGKDGADDDLVSALYWSCYITEFDIFDEDISINTNIDDEGWGILSDVDTSIEEWYS